MGRTKGEGAGSFEVVLRLAENESKKRELFQIQHIIPKCNNATSSIKSKKTNNVLKPQTDTHLQRNKKRWLKYRLGIIGGGNNSEDETRQRKKKSLTGEQKSSAFIWKETAEDEAA